MAQPTGSAKILLVSKTPSVLKDTQKALAEEENLTLVDRQVSSGNLFSVIDKTKPDIVLLDFDFQSNPLNFVDRIVTEYPTTAVIAILTEGEAANLDRVILAGARAFVQYPYKGDKLTVTIKRVVELLERNQGRKIVGSQEKPKENPTNTFAVFSPKGGVGTTTVATNLAISLHNNLEEDVLLIDGKHLFGHVPLYLNLRTGNSITDLISHAGQLDERLVHQVVVKHTSGIYVLPSPNGVSEAQGIRPENLFKVVKAVQRFFPNIIIDAGNRLDENSVTYMDASDKILLVLTPDLASMRDARQFLDISSTLSYSKEKILLILNMAGRKADVKLAEIEHILKKEIFGKIPADENVALSSLNEGVPIILKKSRHSISRAYNHIAKDLVKLIETVQSE